MDLISELGYKIITERRLYFLKKENLFDKICVHSSNLEESLKNVVTRFRPKIKTIVYNPCTSKIIVDFGEDTLYITHILESYTEKLKDFIESLDIQTAVDYIYTFQDLLLDLELNTEWGYTGKYDVLYIDQTK